MRRLMTFVLISAVMLATPIFKTPVCAEDLKGEIKADGSSTVYLVSEAMAVNFKRLHPNVRVSVGISGTGGGFKKFAAGETDISNASRMIKPAEADACKKNGIEYLELQVAWDGLTVVIHPENTWAKKLTVEQLKKIWHPDTDSFKNAKNWSDVDPQWPKEPISLWGAGPDSGTFDYFTEAVNQKEKVIRKDYHPSEDDNVIVKGVASNKYAIGFFGLAYFEENKSLLQAVAVAEKDGAEFILPTAEAVMKRTYKPLGRPLYVYVKKIALKRPEVKEFAQFHLQRNDLVKQSRYIPLTSRQQLAQQEKLK